MRTSILLIILFCCLIDALTIYFYSLELYGHECKKITKLFFGIVFISLSFILIKMENAVIEYVSVFCLSCLFFSVLTKSNITNSLLNSVLIMMYIYISKDIVILIVNSIIWDTMTLSIDEPITYAISACIEKLMFCMLVYIRIKSRKKRMESEYYHSRINMYTLLLEIICLLALLSTNVIGRFILLTRRQSAILIASTIIIFSITMISLQIFDETQRNSKELLQLQFQEQLSHDSLNYYKIMKDNYRNQQILIHDIKNHLMTIKALSQTRSFDKIDSYITGLLSSPELIRSRTFSDNDILNIILNRYTTVCENEHIPFSVYAQTSHLENMKPEDITSLLCNMLENAVDSINKSHDTSYGIKLLIKTDRSTNSTIIQLENSSDTMPATDSSGLPVTTKNNSNHGFGMRSIKNVAKKYGGDVTICYDTDRKTFKTIVLMFIS